MQYGIEIGSTQNWLFHTGRGAQFCSLYYLLVFNPLLKLPPQGRLFSGLHLSVPVWAT